MFFPSLLKKKNKKEDTYKALSRWQLMKRKFFRNKLGVYGGVIIIIFYIVGVLLPGFFSVNDFNKAFEDYIYAPPQVLHFFDEEGKFHLRPFVYNNKSVLNMETYSWEYTPEKIRRYPIYFFNRGDEYRIFGLFKTDIHFIGLNRNEKVPLFIFGTDRMGRDLLARILNGARVSLTVGLIGVAFTIILGSILGTISGYYGGVIDNIIQRTVELLLSFPSIPLWAALAAACPPDWSPIKTFFAISIILSLRNWTRLGRQLRAKILSFRQEEYTLAAQSVGASDLYIIFRHMIPNAMSHIIVISTLSIPGMILAETSLSFLGLGIQPPMVSWGVLLMEAQKVRVVLNHPWLLLPGIFVILSVLAYNFLGDGIRDASDPFAD